MLNKLEKAIYKLVKENPELKDFLKKIYQSTLVFFSNKKTEINFKTTVNEGFFYGFHDRSPWNKNNDLLLTHKYSFDNKLAEQSDKIDIGYFKAPTFSEFKKLESTNSWNLQQGSMLSWLGNNIIYNDWNGEKTISKIIDTDGNLVKQLEYPIGNTAKSGNYAISYSFDRIGKGMPGYGYSNMNQKENSDENLPDDSFLSCVDMNSFELNKLFSLKDIANIEKEESMNDAYHIFTHAQFSPNEKRFLFLHRWSVKGKRPYTRMFTCNIDGSDLHLFPTKGMVSHITWYGNNKIFGFSTTKEGDGFYLFDDLSDNYEFLDEKLYNVDGHPQYCSANNLIVNDSYPNKYRLQELSLLDIENSKKTVLANLFSPIKYMGLTRCDLHPRWNNDGDMICFDSVHTGKRAQCIMFLK